MEEDQRRTGFDFAEDGTQSDNRQLMAAVDQINRRFLKAVSIAATGIDRSWKPKAERKPLRYIQQTW
jgi:DNA polymerase V